MAIRGYRQIKSVLATNVRASRKALGITQEALALETGVDRSFVGQIERGEANPSLRTLCRLAAALKADVPTLLVKAVE
jgi:transcriptional regulator with XRE-family HTH domain